MRIGGGSGEGRVRHNRIMIWEIVIRHTDTSPRVVASRSAPHSFERKLFAALGPELLREKDLPMFAKFSRYPPQTTTYVGGTGSSSEVPPGATFVTCACSRSRTLGKARFLRST